jgi:predicted chitinase
MANKVHNVIRGETMAAIARKYNLDLRALITANPAITNQDLIFPGQKIKIPNNQTSQASQDLNQVSEDLSFEQLTKIMPKLPHDKAKIYLPLINAAMTEFAINTRLRQAAFLSQLAHESLELQELTELANGKAYEGRKDLGNANPGDGARYRGRGPIQLTGLRNYRSASEALNLPLVASPELAADPKYGFRIAGWFWQRANLNKFADERNFDEITRRINGGNNGQASRERYYKQALVVLGVN